MLMIKHNFGRVNIITLRKMNGLIVNFLTLMERLSFNYMSKGPRVVHVSLIMTPFLFLVDIKKKKGL